MMRTEVWKCSRSAMVPAALQARCSCLLFRPSQPFGLTAGGSTNTINWERIAWPTVGVLGGHKRTKKV